MSTVAEPRRGASARLLRSLVNVVVLAVLLYAFFVGLEMMGLSFKLFGKGFAQRLIEGTSNPFAGLFIGILATTLVQSSSTTTSMTVGLVAAGALTVEGAVPIIMGANIGTSVTNTLVSLAHVNRREEFRRAFAGATVHDFFNWLTVLVLFPLELATGYLAKTALAMEKAFEGVGGAELANPLKAAVKPAAEALSRLVGESGALTLLVGVGLLFLGLKLLVDFLRRAFSSQAESVLHRTLFRSPLGAIAAGAVITVMVQSSSITTSTVVPLVGAGVITLEQLFPFTIGANLGTTVTAILAALASGSPAAIAVAFSHLLFNVTGAVLIYPLPAIRRVPLRLARWLGDVGAKNRVLAGAYVAIAFYGLPLLLLVVSGAFGGDDGAAPGAPETPPPAVTAPAEPVPTPGG